MEYTLLKKEVVKLVENQEKWEEAIRKTGFDLEYRVQKILRQHNWHVMNNRYYVDDKTGQDREIDVVAYKRTETEEACLYTCLVISCKKSAESEWLFLTSDQNEEDDDFDSWPMEVVFTDKIMRRILQYEAAVVVEKVRTIPSWNQIFQAPHRVLSFQQINRKSFRNEDDKRIFSSIITTIKASAYEQSFILKHRHTEKEICANFQLLSIFEGGMKEYYRTDDSGQINDIREIKYINRHIVENTDRFHRVHFIREDAFERILGQYDQMADSLTEYYELMKKEAYEDVFCEEKRYRIEKIWVAFAGELEKDAYDKARWDEQECFSNARISGYTYDREKRLLHILWDCSFYTDPSAMIEEYNRLDYLKRLAKEKLKKYFHFDGDFRFSLEPHGLMSDYT